MNQEIKEICHAIADKKGVLIKVLNVRDLTSIADYFILASTRNKKQSQAAADAVEDKMAEKKVHCLRKEGYREGFWILVTLSFISSQMMKDVITNWTASGVKHRQKNIMKKMMKAMALKACLR